MIRSMTRSMKTYRVELEPAVTRPQLQEPFGVAEQAHRDLVPPLELEPGGEATKLGGDAEHLTRGGAPGASGVFGHRNPPCLCTSATTPPDDGTGGMFP